MNLVRWDPLRELEHVQARLNQIFSELPSRSDADASFFTGWAPAVDIQESDKEFLVKADLPEVKKDDVKVSLENGVLTVEGERRQEKEEEGKKFHKLERAYGRFVRRFTLPIEIDAAKVQADFKEGVLNVHLPKTAAAKPRSIQVKVA